MIENILNLVKEQAIGAITNNADVPTEKREEAIEATTTGFVEGLKKQLIGGTLSSLLGSKAGSTTDFASQAIITPIVSFVESKLINTVGLSQTTAKMISTTVVPTVMKLISSKSNEDNNSFNIESLLKELSPKDSSTGSIIGAIGGLFGKS